MDVDETGEGIEVSVSRALVRSRAQLDYAGAQRSLDDGTAEESLLLLREVGTLRQEREARRGGITLPIPEQEVYRDETGYALRYRAPLPIEGWNAQISLMTGMGAAELMLNARIGVLRTLPQADRGALARLRRTAKALEIPWPEDVTHAELIRCWTRGSRCTRHSCPSRPSSCGDRDTSRSKARSPEAAHAGVASTYAHTTAPLRRLVDRYVGEICLAVSEGADVPEWARSALPALPETMDVSNARAQQYESGIVSTVEAAVLEPSVGETFQAVVVDVDEHDGAWTVQKEPAVTAAAQAPTCRWASASTSRSKWRTSSDGSFVSPSRPDAGLVCVSGPRRRAASPRPPSARARPGPRARCRSPRRGRASSRSRAPRPRPRAT